MGMPLVQIEIVKGRSASEKEALFDAVHNALVEAIKIPDDDRVQMLIEYENENFDVPRTAFTIVRVTMFPGRSTAAKRDLYHGIVARLGELGIAPRDVFIVLQEPPLENWGIRGGIPASEVELGFELDV